MNGTSGPVWRVVDVLLRLPALHELSQRNLVVRMLADAWGTQVPVSDHPRAMDHLFDLVDACRCRPGGMRALLDVLDRLYQGNRYLSEIHRVVDPMVLLEMWPDGERDLLFTLLDGVPLPDIGDLYRTAAGPWAPPLRHPAAWWDAFTLLETLTGGSDGVPRTVVFVELLANAVRPDVGLRLREWSDRQAVLLGVTTALTAVRQRPPLAGTNTHLPPQPSQHPPAYLVLLVAPEDLVGDMYRLSHWRQLDTSSGWLPDHGEDHCGSLESVKQEVARLVESTEVAWARYQPAIVVEFVLPEELLNLDVDQWAWDTDPRMPEPIGCHFPVVIRSLDRMAEPKWHRPWYQRWRQLTEQLSSEGAIAPTAGYWSTSGDADAIRAIMIAFEQTPSLVVFIPSAPPHASSDGANEVAAGFRKGVPVMVWHREDCQSTEFVSAVKHMLHGHDSHDVLERARLIRLDGFAAGVRHVGSQLTVLWDDPGRTVIPNPVAPPQVATA